MGDVIVVTGATGHVGHALATRLLSAGRKVRAVARGAEKLGELKGRGAEVQAGSLDDRGFTTEAFRGAAVVFAMLPPDYTAADGRAHQRAVAESVVAAIRGAGVTHVVSLSSVGADVPEGTGPIVGLRTFEQLLDSVAGLNVVHLRPTYFMENHLASIGIIKSAGVSGSPIKADLKMPMIATKDVATAAAGYLADARFHGRTVSYLLGPRDYTQAEATRILGASVGRTDLAYVEFPEADARKGMIGAGLSASTADLFLEMYRGFNSGLIQGEPRSEANTTPTTLEEFAKTVFAPAFGS